MLYNSLALQFEKFLLSLAIEISLSPNSLPREERDLLPLCLSQSLFPENYNKYDRHCKTHRVCYFCSSSHRCQYKYHPELWEPRAQIKACSHWAGELHPPGRGREGVPGTPPGNIFPLNITFSLMDSSTLLL